MPSVLGGAETIVRTAVDAGSLSCGAQPEDSGAPATTVEIPRIRTIAGRQQRRLTAQPPYPAGAGATPSPTT
jgi:hypothetical protein